MCNKEAIVVKADKERLDQVISNLLSNAIKFTKEGTIYISEQKGLKVKDVCRKKSYSHGKWYWVWYRYRNHDKTIFQVHY